MKSALIVEDLAETRAWLGAIIQAAFGGQLTIDTAATMKAGLAAAQSNSYDVALIDLGLPDGSGIEVLKSLRKFNPATLCVITTVIGDDAHIVSALSAGADGYLLKDQPQEVLTQQLSQLADGIPALSPSIARRIMRHFRYTGPSAAVGEDLTSREKEVLSHISCGMRNSDVAGHLVIAESTVAHHIKSIYRKLGISSRAEASWHAVRLGLMSNSSNDR